MTPCFICGSQPEHQQARGKHRFRCLVYHGKHHRHPPWHTSRHAAQEAWNHSQLAGAEILDWARKTAPVPRHCEWTLRTGQCGRTATHCDPDTSAWYCQTHARDYEDVFGCVLIPTLNLMDAQSTTTSKVTTTPPNAPPNPP